MAKESFLQKINPFRSSLSPAAEEYKHKIIKIENIGSSGTDITGGILNEEYLQALTGTEAADIFDKMRRSDPKVKMCLQAVMNPIKSASWTIEPADDSDQAKLDAELIEYILFRGMQKTWKRLIHEILTMTAFGYSLFERTHKVLFNHPKFGNFIGLRDLGFRSQRTIERWNINEYTGELETVTQFAFGDGQAWNVDMPAKFLNLFSIDREGDNFEGISLLRPCYGPWLRKQTYLKLQAIGIEKFAVPTPTLKVPEGKQNSVEFNNAVEVLKKYVSHQSNYLTIPEGWEIQFTDSKFDASKVQGSIDAENREIVNAFLANFLELGQSGSGSYALSFDLSDFFLGGIEHIADVIVEEFNSIIKELINLNRGPQEEYPKLRASGIADRVGKEFGDLLKALSDSRYIVPDKGLEKHLRSLLNLPEISNEDQRPMKAETSDATPALFSEKKNSKTIEMAETPRGLIIRHVEEMKALMQSSVKEIGRDLVQQVMAKHKRLPIGQRLDAVKKNSPKGVVDYKNKIKEFLALASTEALAQARKEVPAAKNVKLSEFDRLPKSERDLITLQSQLFLNSQMADLEKAVYFQFSQSSKDTISPEVMEKDLNDASDSFAQGASVTAGAGNTVALVINSARQSFFYDDDVLNEIEAFKFVNPDPKSPICKDLNGRIFAKDDPESERFRPPLHHNCKSYVIAILKGKKVTIDPRGLKPSDPKLEKHISLGEENG